MKPTQVTELLANIKATFVAFFSILMFVALGVGMFLGISWAGPALQNAANDMFREGQFHNFQVQFMYGLTDDDLKQLAAVEGVSKVEAERQSFQTLLLNGNSYTVKVQSLAQDIDVPIVREGELPSRPGEIALHAESARVLGLGVGDTVAFEHDADADDSLPTSLTGGAESSEATAADDALASEANTAIPADGGKAGNASGMKYLTRDSFTVTAIIDSADYPALSSSTYGYSMTSSGSVNALAWVPDDVFDASAFQNGYPVVNVECESLEGLDTFGAGYKQASAEIEERIVQLGDALGAARFDDLHSQLQAKVESAESQLAEGKQKIADGEKQLADGRAELETKKAEGQRKLDDGYQQLLNYEKLRAQGEALLADARAKVAEGEAALSQVDDAKAAVLGEANDAKNYLAEQRAKLKSGKITKERFNANLDTYGAALRKRLLAYADMVKAPAPSIDHENFKEVIELLRTGAEAIEALPIEYNGEFLIVAEARELLEEARTKLAKGQAEYDKRAAQLKDGWAKYYAGQDELKRQTAEGEQKLADGQKQLEEAKAQVAENEPKVQQASEQFENMKRRQWAVMPRAYNAGVGEITTLSDVTNSLSISMAALFIIVGLLVSYFAVCRIVHEQVTQIGTKKALGFRRGEITRSFLLYSGIAVLAGSIIGTTVGYVLVEGIIGGVLAGMFSFGSYPAYFGWGLFFAMVLLELVLILGATYLACRSILKQHAVELLRGEKPPSGKERFYEKWGVWEHLPLFVQTIVNNCVNDKRRMLSTIVGVAGSTALIVTAITLNNDVLKSYDQHYEDTYGFNAVAYVDNTDAAAAEAVESRAQAEGATTAPVSMRSYLMQLPDGDSSAMRVVVPLDESAFDEVYHVTPVAGDQLDLSAEGAWVSQAYAEHIGAKVGDVVTIDGGDGVKHEVPILGFYKFWLTYHEMVVGADYFQKEFGDTSANALLVQTGGKDVADLKEALSGVSGFDSIIDDAERRQGDFKTFSKVSSVVVAIYLALAALMAIVVLLNLDTMFIDEKKRELIVLMINGFSVKDAKKYIAFDSVALTAIGIVVGIILGCAMGSITVASIEVSTAVFVKSVDLWAVAIGVVGSAILAIIMGEIALRRIPKFNLTDISKF